MKNVIARKVLENTPEKTKEFVRDCSDIITSNTIPQTIKDKVNNEKSYYL